MKIFYLLPLLLLHSSLSAANTFTDTIKPKGRLSINIKLKGFTSEEDKNDAGKIISRKENEFEYSVDQQMNLDADNLKQLKAGKKNTSSCLAPMMCALATGNNNSAPYGTKPSNSAITLYTKLQTWALCDEKLVLTNKSEGSGAVTDYTVGSNISIMQISTGSSVSYYEKATDTTAATYPNKIYYIRLFITAAGIRPNINNAAPKLNVSLFDCNKKTWEHLKPAEEYGIAVPDNAQLRTEKLDKASSTYIQPVFNEKELIDFLLNPIAGKTIQLKAGSKEINGNKSSISDFRITLTFN